MSYEGYEQLLCKKGHYWFADAYEFFDLADDERPMCPVCKTPVVWWNSVDQTNCEDAGYVELEVAQLAQECVCHCGHKHTLTPPTYKIPEGVGHRVK